MNRLDILRESLVMAMPLRFLKTILNLVRAVSVFSGRYIAVLNVNVFSWFIKQEILCVRGKWSLQVLFCLPTIIVCDCLAVEQQ